ncbi:hypothetical protein HNR62_003219 [Oceanisphaera litoralis]|uniref:hypothetical protein n=1 Tax=Oceanisphaera litoralis TaxID=225144 RepID=UPI001EF7D9FA|nr:hypothetical protein [Oceanisphaera litoralis]MBM7457307.1 hypothetical protein [Oceanisphaera litoralis]
MSMLLMTGQLLNVFEAPKGTNKEGMEYGGQDKIQLLGEFPLDNGDVRNELVTLTTHDRKAFQDLIGQRVSVPVGVFAPSKGSVAFYIPKGSKPRTEGLNG